MNNVGIYDKENMISVTSNRRTEFGLDQQMKEMLAKERKKLEYQIRTYRGNDPLEPCYNYVLWLEQNCSDDITTILEDILIKFKEDSTYKQDPRLVHILIKYVSAQSNPLEVYQLVYEQGLGIQCSSFFIHWAKEHEKVNDFQMADQVFQLGMTCRAKPEQDLLNAHLQFQLSIARRVLNGSMNITGEVSKPSPAILPFRQRVMQNHNRDEKLSGTGKKEIEKFTNFENRQKFHIADRIDKLDSERRNKEMPKQYHVHSGISEDTKKFERPSRKSEFKCPIAIFEPPNPLKKPMYPKHLVYVDGRDVQLEEIRAISYSTSERAREDSAQQVVEPMNLTKSSSSSHIVTQILPAVETMPKYHRTNSNLPYDSSMCLKTEFIRPVEMPHVANSEASNHNDILGLKTEFIRPVEKSHVAKSEKSNHDDILCLKTEFIRPLEKTNIEQASTVNAPKIARLPNSEVSMRDESCYLRTDFIEPLNMVQPSEPFTLQKFTPESRPSAESVFLKRKSILQESKPEFEHDRLPKQNEDEAFYFNCLSGKNSTSVLHHSPTASFTVNTRAAMNLIQKMWESPLAPRDAKISKSTEKEDLFKMPMTRKSECFKIVNEVDRISSHMSVEESEPFVLSKPTNQLPFPVYCEEDTKSPVNIYARLSSRSTSHKSSSAEERLSSSMESLEICRGHETQPKGTRLPLVMAPQKVPHQLVDKHDYLLREDPVWAVKENDENRNMFDETCSTKAFQLLLPSSTPLSRSDHLHRPRKSSVFNGSYTEEQENAVGARNPHYILNNVTTMNGTKIPTNLSLILENSKEQGSSSGGNVPKSFS